jgi:hypothetical protein
MPPATTARAIGNPNWKSMVRITAITWDWQTIGSQDLLSMGKQTALKEAKQGYPLHSAMNRAASDEPVNWDTPGVKRVVFPEKTSDQKIFNIMVSTFSLQRMYITLWCSFLSSSC